MVIYLKGHLKETVLQHPETLLDPITNLPIGSIHPDENLRVEDDRQVIWCLFFARFVSQDLERVPDLSRTSYMVDRISGGAYLGMVVTSFRKNQYRRIERAGPDDVDWSGVDKQEALLV